jgi:hypothetical protein
VPAIAATLRVDGPRQNAERHGAASVVLDRRFEVDLGYAVLPIRPLWVFVAMVLSVPLCLGLVWILRRGRRADMRRPRRSGYPPVPRDTVLGPAFLCLLSVLVLLVLSPAIVESVLSLTTYAETRCTVLDRTRSGSPASDEGDWTSMAVLRYPTPAGSRVSLGFDVRGTLGRSGNAEAHRAFAAGRDYPCWFDPHRPERVVLRRGPSGAALLALVPAVALLGLLPALRRAWLA